MFNDWLLGRKTDAVVLALSHDNIRNGQNKITTLYSKAWKVCFVSISLY